jgi:hypothetical protein
LAGFSTSGIANYGVFGSAAPGGNCTPLERFVAHVELILLYGEMKAWEFWPTGIRWWIIIRMPSFGATSCNLGSKVVEDSLDGLEIRLLGLRGHAEEDLFLDVGEE